MQPEPPPADVTTSVVTLAEHDAMFFLVALGLIVCLLAALLVTQWGRS